MNPLTNKTQSIISMGNIVGRAAARDPMNSLKALLAAAALGITSAVAAQAADIFTCSGLGYATHDGRVERVCAAPVTTHWIKLGERLSALAYDEPDGLRVVVTSSPGVGEKAALKRFETVLAAGQSAAFSIPRAPGRGARAGRAHQHRRPPADRRAPRGRFRPVTPQ